MLAYFVLTWSFFRVGDSKRMGSEFSRGSFFYRVLARSDGSPYKDYRGRRTIEGVCFEVRRNYTSVVSARPSYVLDMSLSNYLGNSYGILVAGTSLCRSLRCLGTRVRSGTSVLFRTTRLIRMFLVDDFSVVSRNKRVYRTSNQFRVYVYFSLLCAFFRSILGCFLVVVVLTRTSYVYFIVEGNGVVHRVISRFTRPPPMGSLIALVQSSVYRFFRPILSVFGYSMRLISSNSGKQFSVQRGTTRTRDLSIELRTYYNLRLVHGMSYWWGV